jgi:glycosyltransferase involved in cell wall biosynthesis
MAEEMSALLPPITVLHLITGLDRGGAEAMLAKLVAAADPARCRMVVVSMTDEGMVGAGIRAAGVPLYTLGLRRGRPSLTAIVRLLGVIRRERPQVLQSWLYHADLLALLASRLAPGPALAWNLRCSDMELGRYSRQIRLARRVLAMASSRPAAVIVNSEAGRRFHEELGYRPAAWAVLPNGFDTDRFRPDPVARAAWRARLGLADDAFLVGMVARVDAMKDHATFLAAAAQVAERRRDVIFLLAGRGTQCVAPPPILAGRLHALGERDDIAEILAALDLAVLSSAFGEGFPNVLGEAMATGVTCIATDVGDGAAIIGDTGGIVPPRDPMALAARILAWLDRDAAARRKAGEDARRRIVENFALPVIVERYQRLYERLAGR